MPSSKSHKRSSSVPAKSRGSALSFDSKSSRFPAIDTRTVSDVPTLVCLEISRTIMKRPEVNTGSLFRAVAASEYVINKSDAVITISAAILETIGNSRGAQSMLNKSKTVTEFYKMMNLDKENIRNSFVIMLFTLSPEFVKMVESSLKMSLERVQKMTSAPYAGDRFLHIAGELFKEGTVDINEHSTLLNDLSITDSSKTNNLLSSSVQTTPTDMIDHTDSASNIIRTSIVKDPSPLDTVGLMRFAKRHSTDANEKLYANYNIANKPVSVSRRKTSEGVGYKTAESATMGSVTESNFSNVMNTIMKPSTNLSRHALTRKDKNVFRRPVAFVKSSEPTILDNMSARVSVQNINSIKDVEVTRDDIVEKLNGSGVVVENESKLITDEDIEDSVLLDLL